MCLQGLDNNYPAAVYTYETWQTIFFSYCTLKCVFCQNCEISQGNEGYEVRPQELSDIMLSLQKSGCHNINLVSPTHYAPQFVEALTLATDERLAIPIVYNTGGYEELDTLKLLEGVIDIYMPDIKFGDNEKAKKYTKSARYFDIVKAAVKEMHRQGHAVSGGRSIKANGCKYYGSVLSCSQVIYLSGVIKTDNRRRIRYRKLQKEKYYTVIMLDTIKMTGDGMFG